MRYAARFLFASFTLVWLAPALSAQTTPTALLRGRVVTPAGAAVPEALVTALTSGTPVTVTVTTDRRGEYAIDGLPAGTIDLRVQHPAFQTADRRDVARDGNAEIVLEPARPQPETVTSAALLALLPEGDTKRRFILDCTGCHQFDRQTVMAADGTRPKNRAEWREWVTEMLSFAGATTAFPIIAASREAAPTAQWLADALGTDTPEVEQGRYTAPVGRARITEFPLPAPQDLPHDLTVSPDGRVVITGMMTHRMYVLDPATGQFDTVPIPQPYANPRALEIDREGTWWVVLGAPQRVARRTPGGVWESWEVGMYPHSLDTDAQGRVWVNGHFTHDPELLASLDPTSGTVTRYQVPSPAMPGGGSTIPYELRVADDGTVWVTQLAGNRVVRFSPATGAFRLHELPTPHSGPRRMDVDRAGVAWIPEYAGNRLARFDPATESFREWDFPIPDALPYVARIDPDRNVLWIGTGAADAVVRFEMATERFTIYPLPSRGALIRHLDIDRRTGAVWVAYGASPARQPVKIARIEPLAQTP